MLVLLGLKNAVECTSQRLKWTSGARVMTIVHAQLGSEAFPKLTFEGCLERKLYFVDPLRSSWRVLTTPPGSPLSPI